MEKLICNSRRGGAKTSSFARVVVLALAGAAGALSARAAAPESYLEYVATDGSAYIDTGVIGKAGTKVEAGMMWGSISGDIAFVGARNNTDGRYLPIHVYDNKWWFGYKNQKGGKGTPAANTYYTVTSEVTSAGVYTLNVNGDTFSEDYSSSVGNYSSELPLYLFALSRENNGVNNKAPAGTRCYYLKIWQDGVLVRDYKPCYHDGIVTLYDVKNDTYATPVAGTLTTASMTITPSDPQWGAALTVGDGQTIIIDAGEVGAWSGAVTVNKGGTLKTRGKLSVSGTTTVNSGGTLDIESGEAFFAFASKTAKGIIYIRQGATLKMNMDEAIAGQDAELYIYGSLNSNGYRQRFDHMIFHMYDGSRIYGAGNATYAGLDFGCGGATTLYPADYGRLVIHGTVTIETSARVRSGGTFHLACCENSRVVFSDGFYGTSSEGTFIQVPATAEEGNPSCTCDNAVVELGPLGNSASYTFCSKGIVHLKGATASYTITSTGSEVEFVTDRATARSQNTVFQGWPALTTSTAAVRVSGNGDFTLNAAPAYPVIFDGATLHATNGTPIALAAGSSVASATTVLLDGLVANTAATVFTGADATFDVTKLSVAASHNGAPLGAGVTPTLSGSDVVISGVADYAADAWVQPYLKKYALIWLDASDAANFVFKTGTLDQVEKWKDSADGGRDATAYTVPQYAETVYGTYGVANGVPAYCMGNAGGGVDLKYADMNNIRTVFFAMSIQQTNAAFWLGHSGSYNFHRGSNYGTASTTGAYSYNGGGNQNNSWYCDGAAVSDICHTLVPTDRHVFSVVTAANGVSNYLTADRPSSVASRNAGRELSELIVLPDALSDTDRQAIEAYLSAKWMGASPSAGTSDATTYTMSGEFDVESYVDGTKNIVFNDGASISVSSPSASEAMLSTTGSVTIPSGYALPVSVDATLLVPGTYTVIDAGSGITSLSQFNATAVVGDGAAATFAVVDGKLTMTIAATSSVSAQTWRPASSSDLGWNTTSANWLYDGGATGGFIPYVPAFIDGAESATGDITVDGEMFAGPITVTGANDYTFKGDGTLRGAADVTFGGTGTVTLDGPALDAQNIMITNGQKVVLGASASEHALGKDSGSTGGKVEIHDGGQFNANSLNMAGNNTDARFEITQIKTFVIAGDGPDGRGAIVNDCLDGRTTHDAAWGPVLRRVELSDDATIGGTDRFDVRVRAGTAATAVGGIYGPGKNLTIKTTGWFGLISLPIDVESVLVTGGGTWRPEAMSETNFKIPGGITLDNGTLHAYGSTYPATVAFNVEAGGATIGSQNGTTTIKGPLTVKDGSSLTLNGSYTTTLSGAITNNGVIEAVAGTMNFNGALENNGTIRHSGGNAYFAGPLNGTAEIEHTGGETYLANGFVSGDLDVSMSGSGHVFLKEGMKAGVINVNMTAGVPGFFPGSGTAPQFTEFNINKVSGTPGLDIRPQATGMMDVSGKVNANFDGTGTIYVYGAARDGEYGMALNLSGSVDTLIVGYDASHGGDLRLKAGSDLTAKKVYTGYNGSGTAHGRIVIDAGAKLTATSELFMGRYSGNPSTLTVQTMDVSGTLDAAGITFFSAYDTPRDETYLRAGGLMKVNGITLNRQASGASTYNWGYGNGVGATEGRHWFLMEGGRIEMGTGGFNGARIPGVTKVDLQNGELVNVKGAWGGANGFPVFFGYEKLGGKVTFDLDEFYVNWNQALSGASDLTIKGSANLQGTRNDARMQGAMLGKVTVENTAGNDLRVTSAFCGGLTLTNGVNAEVAKYSDERYPFAVAGQVYDSLTVTPWSYPCASANFWNFTKTNYSSNPFGSYSSTAGRGKFYVPAEKAGVWSFCGQCDDWVRLDIDGTQVMKSSDKCVVASGQATLTEGWHTFTVAQQDYTGGSGPSNASGFKNRMAFGFIIGESTSTDGNAYTPFLPGADLGDGLTLQVQPLVNACVWSYQNGNGSWDTTENWTHIKCMDSVEYMHKYGGNLAADTLGYFGTKANRFQGWFKVEDNQVGEWSFDVFYDDNKKFSIDGEVLVNVAGSWSTVRNAKKTLSAGWHRWEIRVSDVSGGWGPGGTHNNYCTISYVAPDSPTEKRFDETNLKLAATLGDIAVLEPTGIYKDLELGAGSTLTSSGTMAMPICGTLKGTGTLAGAWEFAGTTNCWDVADAGATTADLPAATFAAATPATFAGLKSVRVTFDAKPTRHTYFLTDAVNGLTDADLPAAAVTVKDADDGDYSANFTLTVKNGRLALSNSKAGGTYIIVR